MRSVHKERKPRDEATKKAISEAKKMFTPEMVIKALTDNHGWINATAKTLNCSTRTVHNYIQTYPEINEVYRDLVDAQGEGVEKKLQDLINDGNVQAVMFYLRTKWRHKGYTEKIALDIVPFPIQQELMALCESRGLNIVDIMSHMIDEIKTIPLLPETIIDVSSEVIE